ncbi:dynein heavy chain 7, axonemal [Elysia marginata]|uniref:Dynein heavy chain 7, axonemal n=1 Tax=Elysia marginata TaxID=1093978 RepID=A0AAV4EF97_9GAST|nr:dynein heavy chain 7, axonemal [Elysia marginata]
MEHSAKLPHIGASKGKGTIEPIKFLPVLPAKRAKPAWQVNQPTFMLTKQSLEDESNGIDLITELTAREPKRPRKHPVRLKPIDASQKNGDIETFKQPKKDRENFRKALVEIIMEEQGATPKSAADTAENGEVPVVSRAASPTSAEKDILRYYYYIHHGIDTEHVAPMEDAWLENVLSLVSDDLKDGHAETIDNLSDEMREDYLLSVKKAIVDFVLKDPRQLEDDSKERLPPHREEMAVVPKPWNRSYLAALDFTAEHLHNTNPCMMQVLDLWHSSFG